MTDRQKPDSYLVYSILSTLFCCLPLGIVGIVNATKVDPAWNAGRYDEAQRYADTAKKCTIIGIVISLIVYIVYFIIVVAASVMQH